MEGMPAVPDVCCTAMLLPLPCDQTAEESRGREAAKEKNALKKETADWLHAVPLPVVPPLLP